MREKLIELLSTADDYEDRVCHSYRRYSCKTCPYKGMDCTYRAKADHLIANGVTFATDNNVGGKWISVKERLPQSGKCVLVYSKSGGVAEGSYSAYDKKWVQFRWSVKDLEVTHWMPLPSTEGLE